MNTMLNNKFSTSVIAISLSFLGLSQSNTPCSAPLLTVNTSCVNTTVTIDGTATQQTNAANGGPPSCGSMGEDVWYSFVAPAGGLVNITFTAGSIIDAVAGIYDGPCTSPTEIVCDDDGNGLMPSLVSSTLTPGDTYYIRLYEFGGGTGDFDLCITVPGSTPTNISCAFPDPICSGSPITFAAQANNTEAGTVDPGNDYGCLLLQTNPSWYYLKISTGGDLIIDLTAGSDIDYAIWGPYADIATAVMNCGSYPAPLDCSYSPAPTEQVVVHSVSAGEVYVLLVTNYSNVIQGITVKDAALNTSLTDCSIVPLPVELVNFEAERNKNEVYLTWSTVSEINNDYFIVERSKDGTTWSSFDFVDGHGNSQDLIHYSSIDRNFSTEVNYYRIKQFDFDGKMSYSSIISVNPDSKTIIQLFPNPVNTNLMIISNEEMNRVRMFRLDGTMVFEDVNKATKKLSINVQDFTPGVYYIDVVTTNGSLKEKVVVQ